MGEARMTDEQVSRERFEQCRAALQPFSDDAPQELADVFDYAEAEHAARKAAENVAVRLIDTQERIRDYVFRNMGGRTRAAEIRVHGAKILELLYSLSPAEQEFSYDDLIVVVIPAPDQAVNEGDRGIEITHKPTGVRVRAVHERSQLMNRAAALDLLRAKLAILQKDA